MCQYILINSDQMRDEYLYLSIIYQQMLFGQVVRENSPFKYNQESDLLPVILLHNAALGADNHGTTSLWIRKDGEEFLVTTLTPKAPHRALKIHLFVEDEVELFVKGPGSVHLLGTFDDPDLLEKFGGQEESEDEGEDEGEGESIDEEEEISEEEQIPVVSKIVPQPKKQVQQKKALPSPKQVGPTLNKKSQTQLPSKTAVVNPVAKAPVPNPPKVLKPAVVESSDQQDDDLVDDDSELDGFINDDDDDDLDDDLDDDIGEVPVKQTKLSNESKQFPQAGKPHPTQAHKPPQQNAGFNKTPNNPSPFNKNSKQSKKGQHIPRK